ncbi:TPA: hypothetical protein I8Y21_006015 [Klebsiella oxytoca]|uniref:Uncharacterized protein n=1 Tax=Klebsiella oxytoca TaxID=571 RepID=A0AAN5LDW1_KLEOX|nr:hypothetical protein [Klebsiella oxytoca]
MSNKVQVTFTFEEVVNKRLSSAEGCEIKSSVKVSKSIVGFDPNKHPLNHPYLGYALTLLNSTAIEELIRKEFNAMVKHGGGEMIENSRTETLPDDTNLH